jgi:hypothetical protein
MGSTDDTIRRDGTQLSCSHGLSCPCATQGPSTTWTATAAENCVCVWAHCLLQTQERGRERESADDDGADGDASPSAPPPARSVTPRAPRHGPPAGTSSSLSTSNHHSFRQAGTPLCDAATSKNTQMRVARTQHGASRSTNRDKIRLRCTSPRRTDLSRASLSRTCSIAHSTRRAGVLDLDPPDWIGWPRFSMESKKRLALICSFFFCLTVPTGWS